MHRGNWGQAHRALRVALLTALALGALLAAVLGAPPARAAAPHIAVMSFVRDVDPASARYVADAVARAEADGAVLLVLQLDTPGGDLTSMKAIVQTELASRVPIAVYVTPSGGRAASAGMFVALAAPVVAMAPNTTIGAASPVTSTGSNLPSTLNSKIENDLLAQVRSLQATYGRNSAPAEEAVRTAASFNDSEAAASNMISLRAATLGDLLRQLDGSTVTLGNGTRQTLHLSGLPQQELRPSLANQLQVLLFDPTVLFLLFILAAICIFLELAHPGAIIPGTVGVLALVLFLFGASVLSPNWAGLVLMLLAVVLLAIDLQAPTHGVLTVGALVSLVAGTLIFFEPNVEQGGRGVSVAALAGATAAVAVVALVVLRYLLFAKRRSMALARTSVLGALGRVVVALTPEGRVRVLGEDWAARLPTPPNASNKPQVPSASAAAGVEVRVVGMEGLVLVVEPIGAAPTKE